MSALYSQLTPKYDLGKKQPKKQRVKRLISNCQKYNRPVRRAVNPGYATIYQPEFLTSFREICRIYASSEFKNPAAQVLRLMLENDIHPCRADQFNEEIIKRLAGDTFAK